MPPRSRVVLLNGVGSAGKTSIARTLQAITRTPFLHVAMDVFLDMLPAVYQDHPESFRYEPIVEAGMPSVAIHVGPLGHHLMAGLRAAVAGLAAEGNNIIVDDVIFGEGPEMRDFRVRLAGHDLMLVGVRAPLSILEARERDRGDRLIGLARWQYPRVHAGMTYDLEVDTYQLSPEAAASCIRQHFDL